jgi:hypothetical protein
VLLTVFELFERLKLESVQNRRETTHQKQGEENMLSLGNGSNIKQQWLE